MDVFEAHKYLDPTTMDDSSFLSFSSFADLTRSPYEEFLAPAGKPKQQQHQHHHPRQFIQPQHSQPPQPFGLYQSFELLSQPPVFSSTPPPSSHSDSGSESPSTPYVVSCIASSSYTPRTPAVHDFATFTSPSSSPLINRGGPSRYSVPNTNYTPSHHVSHRSTSSSSDWNSPVTPSLTYKSSVDSLASFAPEPDFFLPPSSTHTAFGWDDQSLGSSSSLTLQSPSSPPSPTPHRVVSNPTLGKNRHPRSVTQVKSLPSLREEGATTMESSTQFDDLDVFALFTHDNSDPIPPQEWVSGTSLSSDMAGTMFEAMNELGIDRFNANNGMDAPHDAPASGRGSVSDGTSSDWSQNTSTEQFLIPDAFAMMTGQSTSMNIAPSLIPDLSSDSTATDVGNSSLNLFSGWQPEESSEIQYNGQTQSAFSDNAACVQYPTTINQDNGVYRPVTAPEQPREASSSFSLALPARPMGRRYVQSRAIHITSSFLADILVYLPTQSCPPRVPIRPTPTTWVSNTTTLISSCRIRHSWTPHPSTRR